MDFRLKVKDVITEGDTKITILDEVSFCYKVLTERRGKIGVRLISKSILEEFVDFFIKNPSAKAKDARNELSGKTINDKYEYGYDSTYTILAHVVILRMK